MYRREGGTKLEERKKIVNITTPQRNKKKREKWSRKLRKKKEGVRKKQQRVDKSVIAGIHQ